MKTLNQKMMNLIAVVTLLSLSTIVMASGDLQAIINNAENTKPYITNDSALRHFNLAKSFDEAGDYESAIAEYDLAIAFDPNFAQAYNNRGVDYIMLIKYRKALKSLNYAIQLDPQNSEYYNHRGIVYYCTQEFESAIEDFSKAIEIAPNYGNAFYNRGIVLLHLEDEMAASDDIHKAADLEVKEAVRFISENALTSMK